MRRPNILIFNPDQWRGDVMGHLGNPAAMTPNIDRIVAEEAVSFRNAFCQNPVCTPSRCSFMTGWYPHTRGHRTMHHMLHPERGETNLLRRLKGEGYFVWWGGKNDLVPGQDGYETHCDVKYRPHAEDYARWGYAPRPMFGSWAERSAASRQDYYGFYGGRLDKGGDGVYCDSDWAHVLGAIDFLHRYDDAAPFCLYLPLTYPHPPYCVEEPWYSAIDRKALPPRIPAPSDWRGKPCILEGVWERQGVQSWGEDRWTDLRATYYGMCARLDHQFMLLLSALRKAGRYEDTAVFLFADHGDFTGDYGLVEKTQNTFEDCLTRVPFVLKPPAGTSLEPGVRDGMVELVDFAATAYDLAGIDPGYRHFGRSLLPMLEDPGAPGRDAVFCEGGRLRGETEAMERESVEHLERLEDTPYGPRIGLQISDERPWHGKAAMCRTASYKYVRRRYEGDELYDLESDPGETNNLADEPAHVATVAELRNRMLTWYMETADTVPRDTDSRG